MSAESLIQLYRKHGGKVADKWLLYLTEYERVLHDLQDREVRLLEIGVQNGGSLEIWAEYFPAARIVLGCDINPDCALLEFEDPRIKVLTGDANSDELQAAVAEYSTEFDIVIDDGSHASGDIVKSFARYFPCVADGGRYIIEDLHCSYWAAYEGGLFHPHSSVSFLKSLADILNFEHWGVDKSRTDLLQGFRAQYGIDPDSSVLAQVHSIEFVNSLCVVRKAPVTRNRLGDRVVAGVDERITQGQLALQADLGITVEPQAGNPWSARDLPPAEELPVRLREVADQSSQLNELRALVSDRESLQREIADQATALDKLRANAGDLETQLRDQRQRLAAREAQLAGMYQSRSWRLTSPLRKIWKFKHFNEKFYLEQNPDVARSGVDPFEHYQAYGRYEGRMPRPPPALNRAGQVLAAIRRSLRFEGGALSSLRAVCAVYRREGLSGVQGRVALVLSQADRNNYGDWVKRFDTLTDTDRVRMRRQLARIAVQPLISIVMPTYNTNLRWLQEAIGSVRGQLYENWELCIADDASTDPGLRAYLGGLAADDERIKATFRSENGHISRASNSALELCSGEWIALMDHDDVLAEHALFHVVRAINRNPSVQLIYSDEDKISERGMRSDPYFKCDWNPDLFCSHNMISHLGVYRKNVLADIGGFREDFEGSQDHDLALRYIERIDPSTIHHIPRVLYHWRAHADSTARHATAKPYAMIAGEKAIQEHFDRRGVATRVEWTGTGYRIRYALPEQLPLVTLIIPTRNGLQLLRKCIESILEKTTYGNFEIVIVDNGSDDPEVLAYFAELGRVPNIRVVHDDRPFNFARLNNSAVSHARGEFIGFINNDIEVISPEWLSEMVSIALQPGVGAVGAKLLYPDGSIQHAGVVLGIGGVGNHAFKRFPGDHPGYFGRAEIVSSYSAVTAACMVISKEVFRNVGGFDEDNLAIAFNDVDLCLKVRESGYRNVWTPYAKLLHHESASRGYEDSVTKQARFAAEVRYMQERWGELLLEDPAYSPNLTLEHEDFSLAWPPRREYSASSRRLQ